MLLVFFPYHRKMNTAISASANLVTQDLKAVCERGSLPEKTNVIIKKFVVRHFDEYLKLRKSARRIKTKAVMDRDLRRGDFS